jgi:hypothetical protein
MFFSDCKEEEDESPFLHERRRRSVATNLQQSAAPPIPENNGRQRVAKVIQEEEDKILEFSSKIAELEQKIRHLGMMVNLQTQNFEIFKFIFPRTTSPITKVSEVVSLLLKTAVIISERVCKSSRDLLEDKEVMPAVPAFDTAFNISLDDTHGQRRNAAQPSSSVNTDRDSEPKALSKTLFARDSVVVCVTPGGEIRDNGELWHVGAAQDGCAQCHCQVR